MKQKPFLDALDAGAITIDVGDSLKPGHFLGTLALNPEPCPYMVRHGIVNFPSTHSTSVTCSLQVAKFDGHDSC